ncbi:MAG: hypothetical protein ACI3YT_04585, partial [Prevotella sp.]
YNPYLPYLEICSQSYEHICNLPNNDNYFFTKQQLFNFHYRIISPIYSIFTPVSTTTTSLAEVAEQVEQVET